MRRPVRVLALAPYPARAPSTRFRLVQYGEALADLGVDLHVHTFVTADVYQTSPDWKRGLGGADMVARGLRDLRVVLGQIRAYDVVMVQRGIAPFVDGWVVRALKRAGVPLVYDFDDAVYLPQEGGGGWVERLRAPRRATASFCRAAAHVLAGNAYLADFARDALGPGGRHRVSILPSVVDTDRFAPRARASDGPPVLGWVGSDSTIPYLETLAPALAELCRLTRCRVTVVAGRRRPLLPGVAFDFVPWSADAEVAAIQGLDVGLYPLEDSPWARGKCGFKALQYLACGVPCVASPVGVLMDIVLPGETGYLADTPEAWIRACAELVGDGGARLRLGEAGRRLVEDRYSLEIHAPVLAGVLRDAAAQRGDA